MRTRIVAMLALALAAAFAAPTAVADPSTSHLDALRAAIQARYDALPPNSPLNLLAERNALARSLAAFRAPSSSVAGDIRILHRVAKPIESVEALAATPISDELYTAYNALHAEVVARRDELPAAIGALVSPRVREKAGEGLQQADAELVLADVALLVSSKTILLRKAHAAVASTSARIARATACRGGTARPGRAYVACFVDDAPFVPRFGGSTAGADGGAETRVTVTGYGPAARDDALEISWDTGAFTGPGTYALDGTSGALVVLMVRGVAFIAQSGEVVVTEFDPAARRIAGTFSGVVENFEGGRRLLTGGVFKTCYAIAKR
jgi:hypothetical protein